MTDYPKNAHGPPTVSSSSCSSSAEEEGVFEGAGERRSSPVQSLASSLGEQDEGVAGRTRSMDNGFAKTEVRVASGDLPPTVENQSPELGGAKPADDETVVIEPEEEDGERARVLERMLFPLSPAATALNEVGIVSPAYSPAVATFNEAEIVSPAYGLSFCGCFG